MVDAVRMTNMKWLVVLTELGALAATTSVILVLLIAQPRVFYSMANDGLIPRVFAKVHPNHKVSDLSTWRPSHLLDRYGRLKVAFFSLSWIYLDTLCQHNRHWHSLRNMWRIFTNRRAERHLLRRHHLRIFCG